MFWKFRGLEGVGLLEGVSLGVGFEVSKARTISNCLSLCLLLSDKDASSQLLVRACLPAAMLPAMTEMDQPSESPNNPPCQVNAFFCKSPWSWYLLTSTEKQPRLLKQKIWDIWATRGRMSQVVEFERLSVFHCLNRTAETRPFTKRSS